MDQTEPDPVHPELRRVARFVPRHGVGPRSLKAIRALQSLAERGRPPAGTTIETWGTAEVRVHRPSRSTGEQMPGVLWIHGGGHVIGAPSQDDAWCGVMAERLGAVVAAVRYRLSPEDPHPAAIEDCHRALVALASRAEVDQDRVGIAGASAGGGLAAGLAIVAVERGEVSPVIQVLVYPMLDDRTASRPVSGDADMRLWDAKSNEFGWRCYLGRPPGSDQVPPSAAPARQDDLSGLPPAWIGVGTHDLFLEEDRTYAERLVAAGVPCELVLVPGAFHGFDAIAPRTSVARSFRESQLSALADALGVAPDR